MIELEDVVVAVMVVIGAGATGVGLAWLLRGRRLPSWVSTWWRARRRGADEAFSDPGFSVEVDCRACGQFNRVPSHRLRDRPKCGRCNARLMPGKRVVLCRVSPMEGRLRAELNALWKDEDQLWQSLADHVAIEVKAKAEARDPHLRVVN